ncbi:MAG: GGDEF domain-containing protein [Aquabacterium sp.]|nr:GGDEF domain-containing protein [Aquabacterium sp.]
MPDHTPPPFRLTWHFSLASLAGVLVVMVCLLLFYREHTTSRLASQVGLANAEATKLLANVLWPKFGDFVVGPPGRSRAQLLADPRQQALQARVRDAMRGLQLVKLKIYDRSGVTVFSTDLAQVGEDKRDNPGLRQALAGTVVSAITHRHRFDAMEGALVDRDLIASYVPVGGAAGTPAEAVFEVYGDVTRQRQNEAEAWYTVAAAVLALLSALYLFLLVTVRRADRVMAAQEQARAEQAAQVLHLAYHDGLTGLPNRRSCGERLTQVLAVARRQQHTAALMFIDLDGFKAVNDRFGHAAGDLLLQAVAGRIQSCLREGDLLFRMGGDEFTAVLPRVAGAGDGDADAVACRVLAALARPVALDGSQAVVGASIGIALFPADALDADSLLRLADDAMYQAKALGKGCHAFHATALARPVPGRAPAEGLATDIDVAWHGAG